MVALLDCQRHQVLRVTQVMALGQSTIWEFEVQIGT